MGCDIHSYAEVRKDGKWELVGDIFPADDFEHKYHKRDFMNAPFRCRSYRLFGFLANVRNYSKVPFLSDHRNIPDDSSLHAKYDNEWGYDGHSASWLSLKEMLDFDYNQTFEDRRCTKQTSPNVWDGAALADIGEGEMTTYKDFLPEEYFRSLDVLKTLGDPEDVRVVFWFDN